MTKKAWWKSKTVWLNVLTIGAGVFSGQFGDLGIPPDVALLVNAGLNLALRITTKEPIGASDRP